MLRIREKLKKTLNWKKVVGHPCCTFLHVAGRLGPFNSTKLHPTSEWLQNRETSVKDDDTVKLYVQINLFYCMLSCWEVEADYTK